MALSGHLPPSTVLAQWDVGPVSVGLDTPLLLLAIPVTLGLLAWLALRSREGSPATRRTRRVLFLTRALVVTCLLLAAAGPYTVSRTTTVSDPRVTILTDDSASMDVFDTDVDRLVAAIEDQGVPVRRAVVGSGNESRVGDGIVSNVEAGGNVLLVSDGRVTEGRSLEAASEFARRVNATISTLELGPPETERFVRVAGPPKTTAGVGNDFLVSVDGVGASGSVPVSVSIDGRTVVDTTVTGNGTVRFNYTFDQTGVHRVVASIESADAIGANDVSYRTVQVVDPPKILYVSRGEYPFLQLLTRLYDVTTAESVPGNLDPYTAVILQDIKAPDVGNLDALRSFVIEGNGLVVVGGKNAFENGEYATSTLSTMLPVQPGQSGASGATVVLAIDVSGSTVEGLEIQKGLALDVLDQLDPEDQVGIVAFEGRAYRVSDPRELGPNRALLEDRIRRLVSGGGTDIARGLTGASQMLGDAGGNVVLLSDGLDDSPGVLPAARTLGADGIRVITVGVGPRIDEQLLRGIARESGGTYLRATETSRLRVLFGDRPRSPTGGLTVVDSSHFVTAGITPTARPGETNAVSIKQGADFLIAAGNGAPAFATWRFGLGRVLTITAYGSDGSLDGLLESPNSLLLSRSVNWVIGDPERKSTGLVSLADTRLGESTLAVYVGQNRPTAGEIRFSQVAQRRFEASVAPTSQGFDAVLGREYAVDYPLELAAFGASPSLSRAVESTGGRRFTAEETAAIAEFVRRRATVVESVRTDWVWPFALVAMAVYLLDVAIRRLHLFGAGERTEQ